jgi:AAA15 family ATPase/GTPase
MLKRFSVKNFKAFEDKVTLDLSSIGNYEFNKECISNGICKTALLYGKNASGKSSLCFALFDIVEVLTDKYVCHDVYKPYKHILHQDAPTEFEYEFKFDTDEVFYKYSKSDQSTLISEELIINQKQIFSYKKDLVAQDIAVNLEGAETLKVSPDKLNISLCRFIKNNALLKNNLENSIFQKFFEFVENMLMIWSFGQSCFIGYKNSPKDNLVKKIIENRNFEKLQQFFLEAGFTDKLTYKKNSLGEYNLFIQYDDKCLDFNDASSNGMKALLLIYYYLENKINQDKRPSFVCIDIFDAFFSFELSYFIVNQLKDCNTQALLTTYNTCNFSNDLLRPDCYFLCSKNKIVDANNATDKELRRGHNLEKLYRGGAFSFDN